MRIVLAVILYFSFGIGHAADRELAADGDAVRLTIRNDYRCGSEATIKITTSSAAYFDQDAQTIQRLSDTARAVLGFECPKISKIEFIGYTDGKIVFSADAAKDTDWRLQTDPAPLEAFALFFSLYDPAFFHLGAVSEQFEPFRHVDGITDTYQFDVYEKQAKRLASVIDGNTDQFRSYLKNQAKEFESFEEVLAHYNNILKTIETYAPNYFPAYNKVYSEVSASLKNDYWSDRIAKIVEEDDKTVSEITADAITLTKTSPSSEFTSFVDNYVASWINEEASFIKDDLSDAPLYEVAWASDYVSGFPDPVQIEALPKTKMQVQATSGELLPLIAQRTEQLQSLAVNMIKESGANYADSDAILETGFALAGEFEEAGYADQGQFLVSTTAGHIDNVLKNGLQNYRNELSTLELTGDTVAALQEQASAFEALSAEFEGFAAYKDAVEDTLDVNKGAICEGILKDAGARAQDYKKYIYLGNDKTTLVMLACDLFENQHDISEFKKTKKKNVYVLGIDEADGAQGRFILQEDNAQNLHVKARFEDKAEPISKDQWQDYITKLIEPPPSGRADASGVRECDRLAADPYDPKKLAAGIDFNKTEVDPDVFDRALDSCIAAVENDPEDARQLFQLGRLLWYAGDQETAGEYIKLASAANYASALYYQAEMLLGTSDDPDAFIDALDMFELSAKGGYSRGSTMVKELNPDGIDFFKEIPPPTGKEILGSFAVTSDSRTVFGVTRYERIVDVRVKDCFQISATDFSCEYKVVLECGMRSNRPNDFAARLLSWAAQKDCDSTMPGFDTFRKIGDGKWKELK